MDLEGEVGTVPEHPPRGCILKVACVCFTGEGFVSLNPEEIDRYLRSEIGLEPRPSVDLRYFQCFQTLQLCPLAVRALCGWVADGKAEAVRSCPALLDFCIAARSSLAEFALCTNNQARPIGVQVLTCQQRPWLKKFCKQDVSTDLALRIQ